MTTDRFVVFFFVYNFNDLRATTIKIYIHTYSYSIGEKRNATLHNLITISVHSLLFSSLLSFYTSLGDTLFFYIHIYIFLALLGTHKRTRRNRNFWCFSFTRISSEKYNMAFYFQGTQKLNTHIHIQTGRAKFL